LQDVPESQRTSTGLQKVSPLPSPVQWSTLEYFEDEGTDEDQFQFFWYSAARYGHLEVMQWAHQQGYSAAWNLDHVWGGYIGANTCAKTSTDNFMLCSG